MNRETPHSARRWQFGPALAAALLLLGALWGATAFPRGFTASRDQGIEEPAQHEASRARENPGALAPVDEALAGSERTLTGGLVMQDLVAGTGAACATGDTLRIRFVAQLWPTGTEYDSTEKRRRDFVLDLANPNVIAGLREGLPGMRAGGVRRLTIPHPMAYGETGREPIPPRTDLRFTVELVEIVGRPSEAPR